VVLVGRQRLEDQVAQQGVVLETVGTAHACIRIPREDLRVTQDAGDLQGCDVVLVAVKTTATAAAAEQLAALARRGGFPKGALVLSLQNGVGNGAVLAAALEPHGVCVLTTMVNFNVVWSSYCDSLAAALHIRWASYPNPKP
jgi:2-dehydropantoate 2-reductase